MALKWWVAIVVPVGMWVNKKRKEYLQLVDRVKDLEEKFDRLDNKFDDRFDQMIDKMDKSNEQINDLHKMLYQVKEDTAVNKAKLED
ncbi:putative TMhelix containing protein [Vibrio phage 424E50-1]|nr:putative TMhelix containing protein [Vibrio phage 501E54-1]CAH9015102.1 putative TMhelix containing protein [Vibrio phage 424E50-1]